MAGYLAASARLGVHPPPGAPVARRRTRKPPHFVSRCRPAPATRCPQTSASDEMCSDQRRDVLRPAPATRCPLTSASDEMSSDQRQRRDVLRPAPATRCQANQNTRSRRWGAIVCSLFLCHLLGRGSSCVACAYWSTVGELARISLIGRERRQVLMNSAHVRADSHVDNGVGVG